MKADFKGVNDTVITGEVVNSLRQLRALHDKLMKVTEFAYDTETDSLDVQGKGKMNLVGISICFGEQDTYYIPVGHYFDTNQLSLDVVVNYMKPCFEREDVRIIGHNLKFDIHVLANVDINIKTLDIFDTMIARWITDENREKSLKGMTNEIYDTKQQKFDACISTVTPEQKKAYGLKSANKAPFLLVSIENGAPYALADAYWTWRHYVDWQMDSIKDEKMETIFYKAQMPFLRTLYNMERRGVRINADRLKEMAEKAEKDLEDLQYKMIEIAGVKFSPTSGQQLAELLFGYQKFNKAGEYSGNRDILEASFHFPVISETATGVPQTGDAQLKNLGKKVYKRDKRKQEGLQLVKLLRKYKRLAKLKSAFIDGLIKQQYSDGKVHPSFNQVGTDSGRLSCSNPNLQQLPRPIELEDAPERDQFETDEEFDLAYKKWEKDNEEPLFWKFYEIRDVFICDDPETESLMAFDYSNLEMRILAHFSLDPNLVETFVSDSDAHASTAKNMFQLDCDIKDVKKKYKPLRQIAKTLNFLLMYGGSPYTLYNSLSAEDAVDEHGDPITEEKAREYYDKYFEAYAGVSTFIREQKKFAHKHEYVNTLLGRKRRLPSINSNDKREIGYCERLSVNSAIQGSGGDIMMMCQPKIDTHPRLLEMGCTMRLQVHDELVFVCPKKHLEEATAIIKEIMEHPLPKPLNIPLRVDYDYGSSYAEAK